MSDCTYKITSSGEVLTGQPAMKAYLAEGGLDALLPEKDLPWRPADVRGDYKAGRASYDETVANKQDDENEPTGNDRGDKGALASVSPGELLNPEGGRPAGQGSKRSGRPYAVGNGSAGEDAQHISDGSVAGKPRAVLSERPDEVEISGEARPLEEVAESVKNDPPASEPKPRFPARFGNNPGNYRITDADQIGTGTAGQRIRANMAAIRLVLELERENRYPTREEQSVLVKYVGWGGLKNVFKGDNSASKQEREAYAELKESLTPEQLFWMGQSVLNAHYTSPKVVGMMYRALEHFGVDGGRFLEPTVGSGNFIGLMPDSMASGAKWFASEIDPLTSLIAKNLYPDAQVLTGTGFQDAEFSYGRTDVAIGNPPFGDERITDTNKKRAEISGFKIHNYIIAKSAMHLRPGGIMEFVVTSRFLDTADSEARDFLQKNFRFLGAVRLPNDAFAGSAGTEVTTDILFLQRLRDGQREGDDTWLDTAGTIQNEDGETIRLNRYFAENPSMMLGKPSMQGTMYGSKEEFTLKPIDGMDIAEAFERILSRDWRGYQGIGKQRAEDREAAAVAIEYNREDVPIGGFYRDGERIVQRTDDDEDGNTQFRVLTADTPWTEKTTLGDTRLERIKGMMDLRDMAYDLMAAERSDAPQDQLDAKRASLVRRYDAFVAEHGYLNDPANRKLMDDDPRIEFGLEANYTKKISAADSKRLGVPQSPAKAEKTSLLRERVFFPKQEVLSADTPADGYAISLSEKGKLDLDYVSELTGLSVDKVTASLSAGESPLIYRDPVLGRWVQEDEYLSGNVKDKLKMARGAGLEANIKALEAVQPVDVAPQDIHAEFGATWIRPSVYEDFLKLFGYTNPQVSVLPKSGAVEATSAGTPGASIFRADVENSDYSIVDVFSAAANRRQLIAYDGSGDDRHINPERTENLGRIRNKMIAIWRDWIKSDAERADLLARDYNEMMNTTVERKYDGVRHLRTVGANPAISLRNSQKDSSWRMIQSSVTLMDHVVGAGKTIAITTGLMERKRLGLSKKPMVVVPNHLVGQWARDWMALYPGANILAATEKDFAKANRRRLFARIATGKFDAIIVGHSSFGFIPVSSEAEVQFVMKEVEFLEDALTEAKTAESSKKGKGDSRRVRGIKNRIAKRMEKIKELQDKPRDNVVPFEDMGVDYLAVDEFHEFKNLEYATTLSNVAGMGSPEGSKKAFDLYMKLRLLQEWGGGVAGATGTPISNSLVEMYSLLRYLNPGALAARNLEQFDAWVKMYASIEPRDEYTAAGKIKQRTVLAAFNNLPELLQMYKQVADTVTMSDLKRITAEQIRTENRMKGESKREEFPVPKVKGGTRRLDIGAPTDEQVEFMDYLIARADILDKMKGKEKQAYAKIDNALWLMNDARKMSLDVRIIDPSVPDNKSNKVNRAARNIKEIYDRTDDDLGVQLVFCDLSTPAKNASKDAKDFIRGMMKTLGFSDDAATASALDGKSYAEQWRYLKMRADMLLDGGDLNDAKRESIEGALEKVSDDNLSALQVADSGFSVYDALKTRLIDSGIPEREIAFIHDATTSDKKRELFDLVKAGRVRVLIGSSAKMGAGTNVQTRLVALHHMDAPWRPSDIEQREGRIIRQGNMFYDRDPDGFEVEIVAYSTERTFDAQMWGVLARKAAFLEQFRHGLRTITEEGSDADSYAEFMAEATGDQIFRQKIQLERELNDIEAEERSSKMKRQASENIVRTASEKQARLDARLAEAKTLAAADLSRVTFDGNAYRNDMYDVLQSETEAFRIENEAFQKAEEAYRITRKAWEDAAGTERGRAPQKPVKPEVPEIGAKRVVEKSEWARFVNALTRKFELIPEAMTRGFDVVAANGTVLPISVSRGSGESVFVTVGGNSVAYATPPRSSIVYASLTPNSIQGTTKGAPQRIAKEISSLAENVRQAQFTLDHVKAVSPEAVADVRNRYEAVKKAVDEASARMAEERAQRDNRFIGRDKTRFSEVIAKAPKITDSDKLAALSSKGGPAVLRDTSALRDGESIPRDQAEAFIRSFVAEFPGAPPIMLADSFSQLPKDLQADAISQGSSARRAKGALKDGKAFVVLNNHHSMADLEATVFHEILGHTGTRKLLGPQFSQELNKLFIGLGGYSGLERIMQARGMGRQFEGYFQGIQKARASNPDAWTDALAKSILTEEVFAHIAEQRNAKQLRDRFMALVGMVRDWLRKHGFMELARLGESDIVFMLQHAREGLRDGSGIVRDGATVGENEIVGEDGRPIAKEGSPEYEAIKLLSGRLGLRERSGPTVFKDGLQDDENQGQDAGMDDAKNVAGKKAPNPAGDVEGSAQWAYETYQSGAVPDGWYVHGRQGRKDLNTGGVLQLTRDWDVADQYSGQPGSSKWLIRPKSDANTLDLSGSQTADMDRVVDAALKDFDRNRLPWLDDLEAAIGREAEASDVENAVRDEFSPDNIVDSAKAYDSQSMTEWLAETFDYPSFVETPDGAVVFSREGIDAVMVPSEPSTSARPDVAVFRTDTYAQPRGQAAKGVMDNVLSAFKDPSSKVFGTLHTKIATQLHKAWVNKDYGKVFHLADSYERDISRFSADPSAAAPNLLPAFDNIRDAFNRLAHGNANRKHIDGVADAIFSGTLAGEDVTEGRVWNDRELRDEFGMNDEQIGLYHESRNAIDASLDATAAGLAWQSVKKYIPDMKDSVKAEAGNAETIIDGAMRDLEEELREVAQYQATVEAEGALPEGTAAKTLKKAKDVAEARQAAESIFVRADTLKTAGYAPLMRFGRFAVDVVENLPDGTQERIGFYKFETEIEAKMSAQKLQKDHPGAEVTRSVMSEEAWKIFKGVDPDLVAMFAETLDGIDGLDVKGEVLQEWYRSAVNDRSSFKRMIHRKGTEGFDRDLTRVVASFITSNARVAARQFNMGDMAQAIADMQDRKVSGDVVDEAVRLKEYMENPTEPFQGLKGWMFAWFLGGSVVSAVLNLTQPLMMTLPYLSQFGITKAGAELAKAAKEAATNNVEDAELKRALLRASKDGKVDPQQVHHLYHEGMRPFLSKLPIGEAMRDRAQGLMTMWGYMFGATENFNRRITFIAAYRMARDNPELGNPYEFAVKAIDETQGIYSKANRPNWARGTGPFGAVGVAAFTFKQYSVGYVELLIRMAKSGKNGRIGAAMMLGTLVMMSGMQGAPGADDLEDIIDTVSQHLGYTGNSRLGLRNYLRSLLGDEAAKIVMYGGLSALPFDIAGRVGLGNLLPATAIFKPSEQNRASQFAELFGPPLSMSNQVLDAALAMESGSGVGGVANAFAPVAIRNLMKAYDMAESGEYRDSKGRKVTNVSMMDAMYKAGGLQPTGVSAEQKNARLVQMTGERIKQVKGAINSLKARGIVENDQAKRAKADELLKAWNESNPDARIMPDGASVLRRVKEMNTERRARLMKALPREYRRVAEGELN